MPTCPTVRIKFDEKGYEAGIIINESDFDPKIHIMIRDDGTESEFWTGRLTVIAQNPGKAKRARKPKKSKVK